MVPSVVMLIVQPHYRPDNVHAYTYGVLSPSFLRLPPLNGSAAHSVRPAVIASIILSVTQAINTA